MEFTTRVKLNFLLKYNQQLKTFKSLNLDKTHKAEYISFPERAGPKLHAFLQGNYVLWLFKLHFRKLAASSAFLEHIYEGVAKEKTDSDGWDLHNLYILNVCVQQTNKNLFVLLGFYRQLCLLSKYLPNCLKLETKKRLNSYLAKDSLRNFQLLTKFHFTLKRKKYQK